MNNYKDKVLGGLFGKNIGGTLGGPYEGNTSYLHLTYYDPVPTESLPNDDFELQLVWLDMLKKKGIFFKPSDIAYHWKNHTKYYISEYFMGQRNIALGLVPPVTGSFNNPWTAGMGCTIRSEIWALIAPGLPDIAAAYAYIDGSSDHAELGLYGEMFIAAMESAAFIENDPCKLIDIGLSYIPSDCRVNKLANFVRDEYLKGTSPYRLRNLILADYSHVCDFTFVTANIGFVLLGLLYGDDFGESLCSAVNCGYDADCSGATLGALLGIRAGSEAIPDEWTAPVGSKVVVSEAVPGIEFSPTVEGLTDDICALGEQVLADPDAVRRHLYEWTGLSFLVKDCKGSKSMPSSNEYVLDSNEDLHIIVDYVDGPYIGYGVRKELNLRITGKNQQSQDIEIGLNAPEGWTASVSNSGSTSRKLNLACGETISVPVNVEVDCNSRINLSNYLDLTISGRSYKIALSGSKCWLVSENIGINDKNTISDIESNGLTDKASRQQYPYDDISSFAPPAGSVKYMQTDFYIPEQTNIEILANNTAPIKVFLNGQQVIDKKHRTSGILPTWHLQNLDLHIMPRNMGFAKVTFNKGWNRVLLRLEGTKYQQEINFHLIRILSAKIEDAQGSDYRPELVATNTFWKD